MSLKNIKNRYLERSMHLDYTVSHVNVFLASIFWDIWILENAVNKTKRTFTKSHTPRGPNDSILGMLLTVCDPQRNTPSLSFCHWVGLRSDSGKTGFLCSGWGERRSGRKGWRSRSVAVVAAEQGCPGQGLCCIRGSVERLLLLLRQYRRSILAPKQTDSFMNPWDLSWPQKVWQWRGEAEKAKVLFK